MNLILSERCVVRVGAEFVFFGQQFSRRWQMYFRANVVGRWANKNA